MGKVGWGRGFFRLWIGFSLLWCIFTFLQQRPDEEWLRARLNERLVQALQSLLTTVATPNNQHSGTNDKPILAPWIPPLGDVLVSTQEEFRAKIGTHQNAVSVHWASFQIALMVMAMGPVVTLAFGLLVRWILLGFRSRPAE